MCLVCESTDIVVFTEILQVPVHCNIRWKTREEARQAPRGDIRLGFCETCGHIFNVSFDPYLMNYTEAYENSLHFSSRFQEYARVLASGLVDRYNLRGKDIIEIGCGKGDFLSMLCELGGNRGLGFDPSYDDRREDNGTTKNVTFIRDFYSEKYAKHVANLICCRHVLEHIQRPRDFLLQLRRAIGDRRDTVVFFEVPNVLYTLRDLGIWDIIFEHCSYFSIPSLTRIFQETGFRILDVYPAFGDQFLCLEACATVATPRGGMGSVEGLEQLSSLVSTFGEVYHNKLRTWDDNFSRFSENGNRIVVWGAGSKGVTFLNIMKPMGQIRYVVDINPYKHGMCLAGTGHEIVPPKFLKEYRPDMVIVMNAIYCGEIRQDLDKMGVAAELTVV